MQSYISAHERVRGSENIPEERKYVEEKSESFGIMLLDSGYLDTIPGKELRLSIINKFSETCFLPEAGNSSWVIGMEPRC